MRLTPLALALGLILPSLATAQQPAPDSEAATEFDAVTVTATRTARPLSEVPNTVDVINREDMDEHIVRDLQDLFRYEPGVSVGSSFGRFGISDIRIRGLGGNRVRIQTDGIPVSDAFTIGSFSDANRNFVDLDTLKRVEVVRGPTSSLYGSDALGGTVSFITKDPSDYLGEGKDAYFGFRLGYESDWNGLFGGATAAFGGDRWSGLVSVSHRQGTETENQGEVDGVGSTRTKPNPQSRNGRSLLTKLVYDLDDTQRFKLVVEGNEDATDTDVLTSQGFQSLTGANNLSVTADDHQTRARVSFVHEMDALNAGFADSLDWQVYRQDSETTQDTTEVRDLPASQFSPAMRDQRDRSFNFDQRMYGLQANFRKSFGEGVRHDLGYGIDVSRTETRQKRDGLRTFLDTGVTTPAMLPDVFPVRDFPISQTTTAALYLQDEISFADGAFRLVPGLRVDHYKLDPEIDNIFAEDNPGVPVSEISETHVSPKLGAVWHLSEDWSLFGGYSRGFRAPPYNDVNIGFTNVMFGYTAIPNPDLKPETSDGLELGVRFSNEAVYASLAGYHNRYDDFIESFAFAGFNADGLMVYQSQNISEVRIRGVELKAGVDFGALSDAMQGWSLRTAATWQRGEDRTADEPLSSVEPLNAALGLAYDAEAWGAELAGRFAGRRDRLPSTGTDAIYSESPGYGVLDLYAHWNFAPGARVNVGVTNLADKTYWETGGVPLVSSTTGTFDRFTSPGRNFAVSFSAEW